MTYDLVLDILKNLPIEYPRPITWWGSFTALTVTFHNGQVVRYDARELHLAAASGRPQDLFNLLLKPLKKETPNGDKAPQTQQQDDGDGTDFYGLEAKAEARRQAHGPEVDEAAEQAGPAG